MMPRSLRSVLCTLTCLCAAASAGSAFAASSKNPTSKFFVSDLTGESQVNVDGIILPLQKKSVFSAQGAIIETKPKASNSLVYSNGSGIFLGENSRLELRRFAQEPFTPNRVDLETEPSISQTQAYLARGSLALCTSKMVAGSSMVYQTPLATINIRGKRVVIDSSDDATTVSVLEGDCSVRAGDLDAAGHNIATGQQAIIRRGAINQPNVMEVGKIPDGERAALEEKASMACLSRQTVYFDVRDRVGNAASAFDAGDDTRTAPLDTTPGNVPGTPTAPNLPTRPEIVPVEIAPGNLPVDFTVSPSRI